MAFDEEQLAQISNVNGFGLYRYDTLDSLATVSTSGYINNPGDHVGLVVGDLIDVFVWTTSIRFGTISVTERHVVTQVNAVTGDVGLLSLVSGRAIFASGQWGHWSAFVGSTAGVATSGTFFATISDASSSRVTSVDGLALRQNTNGVVGGQASIFVNTVREFHFNSNPILVSKFTLDQTSDLRFFCGLQNGTFLSGDIIGGPAVGVQFSTDRGDTNWQFLKNDGVTQVLVDSGVAPDTSAHSIVVDVATITSVLVRIMDASFVEQASTTFTTGLPPVSEPMGPAVGFESRAAVVKSIDQFFSTMVQRGP